MPEFKPCPFCGNTELSVTSKANFCELQGETGSASIHVTCWKCSTDQWEHSWGEHNYDKRVQLLADKWNRRANRDSDGTTMTVEQAIRLLDPATTGAAIAEIEYYNGFSGRTAAVQAISHACELACEIMRKHEQVKHTMSNDNVNGNVNAILDEIRAFKRAAEKFSNSDYMTGYLSALSALEGFIAGLPVVPPAPTWISVNDRLPEMEGKYIVCTAKGSVYCTKFSTRHGPSFHTDMNTHITHWMPLPEPPEEEA